MNHDTLNRFDRIVAILIHLQSGKVVKAQELADRFQVSLRTVYRDIRSLEASGVPISGEAGVGYSLMEGYRLPPVMFTQEEASSFVAAEKLMQKFSDKSLGAHHESAMFKVKAALKGKAKDRVAALETQIWVNFGQELFNQNTPDALNILLDSIAEKKQVMLQYESVYADASTNRFIEPVGLFNENNYWYVMAYCHLRAAYRQFRTDRMVGIQRTGVPFTQEHGNIDQYRKIYDATHKTKVVIRVDKETARYIQTGRKYYGFVSEKVIGNKIEMTFMTADIKDGLPRWYLMFGDCAEIVEPESLRERVNELLERTKINLHLESQVLN
ncbi:helix-turn-helix transcriptional regulator [Adhaeribacter rhizoryzae]|uniref:YafY family transcriptional regulator n=1 Tax=Adhaeribacter rhizoryzae TaxID=2607907 RepID=A0A5M6D3R8_9BACT|nr:YafY family protein [Adhaeribacter rhizoryzae]KAA5540379.1 YafY family transcriptional regulator [Adhaeribacter rhizoryzae]